MSIESEDNKSPNLKSVQSSSNTENEKEQNQDGADQDNYSTSEARIRELEDQVSQLNNKYLRSLADFENLKKRSDKEKQDVSRYANERFLLELLPLADSLDKAVETGVAYLENDKDCCKNIAEQTNNGVSLLRNQLFTFLEKQGVKRLDSKGKLFNPEYHQALQKIEQNIDSETVIEEFLPGYEINGRLLRPAMVSVAVPK